MRRFRRGLPRALALSTAAIAAIGGTAVATTASRTAGPTGAGTAITPVGWQVSPAGEQTDLGDLPTGEALSPDGRLLLVLDSGQATQALQVVDAGRGTVVQTIPYTGGQAVFAGVAWSPDGRAAYASAGGNNKIRTYTLDGADHLTEGRSIDLPVGNGQPANLFPAGLAVAPDGRRLVVADQQGDAVSVVDLDTGVVSTVAAGHNPYGAAVSGDGATAYVTNQGSDTMSVFDLTGPAPALVRTVTVGTHPNRMAIDRRDGTVYVANGDSDSVSVVPVGAAAPSATIALAPFAGAPVGSNPDGLALSPGGNKLYVANAGNNDVAVVDVKKQKVEGLVPTGWYPTDVITSADGSRLLVTNAKGLGAGPNDGPGHPDPYAESPTAPSQYVGSMMVGTLSRIDVPHGDTLRRMTARVRANNADPAVGADAGRPASVVPRHAGEATPIQHVIYVVKENRTYDQEFGSLGKGNGDPSLNLFGEESAPNSRALQREFVTLDNFYADAEISAQGWNWSVAGNSNPYVEQTWPANYSSRNKGYDYEGGNPATAANVEPGDAYIWDRLADAGRSFRNYGFYKFGGSLNHGPAPADPRLAANDDAAYWGYDLRCPDSSGTFASTSSCASPRVDEWKREFDAFVAGGNLPSVEFVRLPNDHTAGTRPGSPTPRAYVADNDYALGRLVDAVSHSPYWSSTAIFVVEDDAQNGPDHVDAHRTIAQVISPYTRTGAVDSTFYSTVSMLKTMELLVGIEPMTQFDAAAIPMAAAFGSQPDTTPYTAMKPDPSVLSALNGTAAPLASISARQDLTHEDQIDESTFNEAIWRSVKGARSRMPAPRHRDLPPGGAASGRDSDG